MSEPTPDSRAVVIAKFYPMFTLLFIRDNSIQTGFALTPVSFPLKVI